MLHIFEKQSVPSDLLLCLYHCSVRVINATFGAHHRTAHSSRLVSSHALFVSARCIRPRRGFMWRRFKLCSKLSFTH